VVVALVEPDEGILAASLVVGLHHGRESRAVVIAIVNDISAGGSVGVKQLEREHQVVVW
jgi:hypothetical protein